MMLVSPQSGDLYERLGMKDVVSPQPDFGLRFE